jgi:hypothetical protein
MKILPKVAKFFSADGRKDEVVCDGKYLCTFGTGIKPAEYSTWNFDKPDIYLGFYRFFDLLLHLLR